MLGDPLNRFFSRSLLMKGNEHLQKQQCKDGRDPTDHGNVRRFDRHGGEFGDHEGNDHLKRRHFRQFSLSHDAHNEKDDKIKHDRADEDDQHAGAPPVS